MTNKKKFYLRGKYFESQEDLLDYATKWPDMPFDAVEYKKFLDDRYREALMNSHAKDKSFTNRQAYYLLKMHTDQNIYGHTIPE